MSSVFEIWEERAKIAKISRFIGQKLEVLEEGVCKISLPYRNDFEQTFGVIHGGIITLIADTAGYFAAATKVGEMPLATSSDSFESMLMVAAGMVANLSCRSGERESYLSGTSS